MKINVAEILPGDELQLADGSKKRVAGAWSAGPLAPVEVIWTDGSEKRVFPRDTPLTVLGRLHMAVPSEEDEQTLTELPHIGMLDVGIPSTANILRVLHGSPIHPLGRVQHATSEPCRPMGLEPASRQGSHWPDHPTAGEDVMGQGLHLPSGVIPATVIEAAVRQAVHMESPDAEMPAPEGKSLLGPDGQLPDIYKLSIPFAS